MSTININREEAHKAYAALSAEERAAVEKVLPRSILCSADIRDRVRTFPDACEVIGLGHEFVKAYAATRFSLHDLTDECDVLAYLRLRIIVCALNEGWDSRQDIDYKGFGPHYVAVESDYYENLSNEEKERCVELAPDIDSMYPYAMVKATRVCYGNPLALRAPELAVYAGMQFAKEYYALLFRITKE